MKRALTGIAAASMALGMMAPAAFAATTSSSMQWKTISITAGSSYTASPKGFSGYDHGSTTLTTFAPVYYVEAALKALGYTVNWDGTSLWIQTPHGVQPNLSNISVGTGDVGIYVNGTLVKKVYKQVAGDPASGGKIQTSYIPIYYIDALLQAAGESATWNGSGWALTNPSTPSTMGASLSTITASGQTVGTGTQQSPAVNTSGAGVTLSSTLTDANGNPISNANISVQINGDGTATPTVEQGSTFETITDNGSGSYTTNVTTDANGVAKFTVTGVGSYTVTLTAPYSNNGAAVTQTSYVGFAANAALIAPGTGFTAAPATLANAGSGVVPVTVTLPLDSNGNVQSGDNVTFSVPAAGNSAFFTNAQGTLNLGKSFTATTNSSGQATVYVNDYAVENVAVSANTNGYATNNPSTTIDWANASTAAPVSSIGASAFAPAAGVTSAGSTSVSGLPAGTAAYFTPFNGSGELLSSVSSNGVATYTLSASTGGVITNVAGVDLSTLAGGALGTPSSVQLGVTENSTNSAYVVTVNGVTISNQPGFTGFSSAAPYFTVQVAAASGATAATSTLTVTSGSASATATYALSSTPVYVSGFSPVVSSMSINGQSENVSFTVLDSHGNPVANQAATIGFDGTQSNLWITAVNGNALSESVTGGTSAEPTPIPMYSVADLGYNTVTLPSVVSWAASTPDQVTAFTNASGQITLTLQAGSVGYWQKSGTTYQLNNSGGVSGTPSTSVYTYNKNTSNSGVIYFGANPYGSSATQVGQIGW